MMHAGIHIGLVGLMAGMVVVDAAAQRVHGGDEHWDPQFGANGLNDAGLALDIASNGDVYVGGRFTMAGGAPASHVARWDGTTWHPLGDGVNDNALAIAVSSSSEVYVGGVFDEAGGSVVNNIAHYDGVTWDAMDGGANNTVQGLAIDTDGDVYASGWFTSIGGITTTGIARWNGSQWRSVGGGVNGVVESVLIHSSGDVYIAGDFTMAGGTSVLGVARWNGSQWYAVGAISGGLARTITESPEGEVYIGGFGLADSESNVARWDEGTGTWIGVGGQIHGGESCFFTNVHIEISDAHFYVGCGELVCLPPGSPDRTFSAAEWDGSNWQPLGSATNGDVWATALAGEDLFVTGFFTEAGGVPSSYFGRWNASIILDGDIPPSRPTPAVTVSPNPTDSLVRLNVTLHEPASLDIGIYDVLGRRVQKLEYPGMSAGSHVVDIGRYRSGIYLLVIDLVLQRGDVQRITRKVTIVD